MDHTIVHFEIPAEDPERAASFYSDLFGWNIQKMEPSTEGGPGIDYWLVSTVPTDAHGRPTRQGVNGGIMRRMHPQQPFANYVGVESVEEFAEKATALGGQVVVPKSPVAGMGWFLYIKDPEGNIIGLWENDASAV